MGVSQSDQESRDAHERVARSGRDTLAQLKVRNVGLPAVRFGVRGPLSLIGLASVFFLVPIQMRINRHWLRTYNIQPRRVPVVVWVVLVPLALFAVAIRVAS